jgi:hypothetical protein
MPQIIIHLPHGAYPSPRSAITCTAILPFPIGHHSTSLERLKMGLENFSHDEMASESSSNKDPEPMPIQPTPMAHAEHGPLVDHKIPQEDVVQASPNLVWSKIRHEIRAPLAEFFGGEFDPSASDLSKMLPFV